MCVCVRIKPDGRKKGIPVTAKEPCRERAEDITEIFKCATSRKTLYAAQIYQVTI